MPRSKSLWSFNPAAAAAIMGAMAVETVAPTEDIVPPMLFKFLPNRFVIFSDSVRLLLTFFSTGLN
ncbi:hypothetical protein [Acidaminococcus intestini]|uniref:hypothetical protein n=1 Tax=Acidaminococcus intestini TaxID=187327 RepID=UPI003AB504B5